MMKTPDTEQQKPPVEQDPPWVSRRIESFEQAIMAIMMLALVLTISWGVLSRYVVAVPAAWITEVTQICFAWLIFVGASEVHRRRMHIGVDMLTTYLPVRVQRVIAILMEILVAAFCIYASVLGVQQTIASHAAHTSMLHLPLSLAYAGLTLGLAMMSFRSIRYLIWECRRLLRSLA